MKRELKYSVLRYSPSAVAGESINLGMIFFSKDEPYREFYYTKKLARVMNFDDTVSKSTIENLLQSIKSEVEDTEFDIDQYTKFFTNNYFFEKPKTLLYDSLQEQVEGLKRSYFRFDFKPAEVNG